MMFPVRDFLSKYEQVHRKLKICEHLLKKSLTKNFIFSEVLYGCCQSAVINLLLPNVPF